MAKKIMIVDDSATILMLAEMVLAQGGFEVCKASSAEEALTALKGGEKPDMVFTDLNMGAMNGVELIREIRKTPGCQFMPIVMLTTESQQAKRDEARFAGATGWMVKPFEPEAILKLARQFLPGVSDARGAAAGIPKQAPSPSSHPAKSDLDWLAF